MRTHPHTSLATRFTARALAMTLATSSTIAVVATPAFAATGDLRVDDAGAPEDSGSDGAGFLRVPIIYEGAPGGQPVTATWRTVQDLTADHPATAGVDYTSSSGTVQFSGQLEQVMYATIPLIADDEEEENETFLVVIDSDDDVTFPPGASTATATIVNDDGPTVSIDDLESIDEGAGTASFTVTLSEPSSSATTITFGTRDGSGTLSGSDQTTATGGASCTTGIDYVSRSGSATIPARATAAPVAITICDDGEEAESNEDFRVVLGDVTAGNATVADGTGIGTIEDNETGPPRLVVRDAADTLEGRADDRKTATFIVELEDGSRAQQDYYFQYYTEDGTAAAGTLVGDGDYEGISRLNPRTAKLPNGDFKIVLEPINITGDPVSEPDEVFFLRIEPDAQRGPQETAAPIADPVGQAEIVNDDAMARITGAPTVQERDGGSQAVFTIALDHATADDVTITWSTADGESLEERENAVADNGDYTAVMRQTATIPQGTTAVNVMVTVLDDSVTEPSQNFLAVLDEAAFPNRGDGDVAGASTGTDNGATATIEDDDVAVVVFDPAAVTFTEGSAGATDHEFTASLEAPTERHIQVDWETLELSEGAAATEGDDYETSAGTLDFDFDSAKADDDPQTATGTVRINGDFEVEPDESFLVVLTDPDGEGDDQAGAPLTVTILNDDAFLAVRDAQVVEDEGTVDVIVDLGAPPGEGNTVTVDWQAVDGSAEYPADYFGGALASPAKTGTLTFIGSETRKTIPFSIVDDALVEGPEDFEVLLTNADGALIQDATATVDIIDSDSLTINVEPTEVVEGDQGSQTTMSFRVFLAGGTSLTPVTFDFATSNGTAEAPSDYIPNQSAPIINVGSIPAGATETFIDVTINGDDTDEPFELLVMTLSDADGADPGVMQAGGTILNDDAVVSLLTAPAGEGAGTANVQVQLSNQSASDVVVDWSTADDTATAPADYTAGSGTVTLPSRTTQGSFTVGIVQDAVDEPDTERFAINATATGASVAVSPVFQTINDDDALPQVDVADASIQEGNSGTSTVTVPVSLDAVSARTVTVQLQSQNETATASDGSTTGDYEGGTRSVTFAPGETTGSVTYTINGDTLDEANETFLVLITDVTNGAAGADGVVTILDDETGRLSILDSTVNESHSAAEARFTIVLDRINTQDVTVRYATKNGTATAGEDYTASSGTATVAAGFVTTTVIVPIIDDEVFEGDETFTVTLSNATNAVIDDADATGFIIEDDPNPGVPEAEAGPDQTGDEGDRLSFDGRASTDPDGEIVSYRWTFGDGTAPATGATVQHTFDDDGTFTVTLTVTDDDGKIDTDRLTVTLANVSPTVNAGSDKTVEVDENTTFRASGSDVNGDPLSYTWDFGDGTAGATGQTVSHRFGKPGTYTVEVVANDGDGGTDSDTLAVTVTASSDDTPAVDRSSGSGRIETAVQASRDYWIDGGATDVVLARADKFPDALAAGPLAAALDGPLLLTNSDSLHSAVAAELDRLGARQVWILGGTSAISAGVEGQLQAAGYRTRRLAGSSRFATAATIAREVGANPDREVVLALGNHPDENRAWPDALSAGALSVQGDRLPVLLTNSDSLPAETQAALSDLATRTVWIAGGTAAISSSVETRLTALGYTVNRLSGSSRYGTSAAIASEALSRIEASQVPVFLTTGRNFPDGLAAGALAGHVGGLVLLVDPETLSNSPDIRSFLVNNADRISRATILGGTGAVSTTVEREVSAILSS